MYCQTLHVDFHEMDSSAQNVSALIGTLVQGCDLNNLVVMCGESHRELTHKFYAERLAYHLKEAVLLQNIYHEVNASEGPVSQDMEREKDLYAVAMDLGRTGKYHLPEYFLPARARLQKMDYHSFDLPCARVDDATHAFYVATLEQEDLATWEAKNLHHISDIQKACVSGGYADVRDWNGMIRRDVYMADYLCQQSIYGASMTVNGSNHLQDTRFQNRPTLADMLAHTGKDIVVVSFGSYQDGHVNESLLCKNLTPYNQNKARACIKIDLPSYVYDRDFGMDEWHHMAEKNGVNYKVS